MRVILGSTMTLGELLALDRVWDLADPRAVGKLLKFGENPLAGRPEGETARDLVFLADDANHSINRRINGFDVTPGWRVWRQVIWSTRVLLRSPPGWRNPLTGKRALAAFALSPFAWAPRVARRVAPPGTHPVTALLHPLLCDKSETDGAGAVVDFLCGQLTPGGAEGAFLEPEEVGIAYTPALAGLVCRACDGLIPRTKSGRVPRRTRCESCQKAKEYAAWKARDPDKARALWRKSKSTDRRESPGGTGEAASGPAG
jgi:hypothetical protein